MTSVFNSSSALRILYTNLARIIRNCRCSYIVPMHEIHSQFKTVVLLIVAHTLVVVQFCQQTNKIREDYLDRLRRLLDVIEVLPSNVDRFPFLIDFNVRGFYAKVYNWCSLKIFYAVKAELVRNKRYYFDKRALLYIQIYINLVIWCESKASYIFAF